MVHVLEAEKAASNYTPKALADYIANSVDSAASGDHPFLHLVLRNVFPEDIYAQMVHAMPVYDDYRPMHGRSKASNDMGLSTRVKIDLFPEYTKHLPPGKREIWDLVGRALCSKTVQNSFIRRLAPELEKRFGPGFAKTGFFPIPILTRDIPGYKIKPHTDTHWKGITVQLYLPQDASTSHIGTIFHETLPDGSRPKTTQMQFIPNSGYAFSVSDYSWHSADPVGAEVTTRDSILLTYFVDQGPLRFVRNRAKRFGNFIQNELRNR